MSDPVPGLALNRIDGGGVLWIHLTPRAKHPKIGGLYGDALRVGVSAAPPADCGRWRSWPGWDKTPTARAHAAAMAASRSGRTAPQLTLCKTGPTIAIVAGSLDTMGPR